jgi:Amidase
VADLAKAPAASEITAESLYLRRREFLRNSVLFAATSTGVGATLLCRSAKEAIMFDPFIEAWALRDLVARRELRVREVVETYLRRIEALNPKLDAFVTVTAEHAFTYAARLDSTVPGSLPLFVCSRFHGFRAGGQRPPSVVPTADAEIVVRLRRAGGVFLGKTATPEYGGRPTNATYADNNRGDSPGKFSVGFRGHREWRHEKSLSFGSIAMAPPRARNVLFRRGCLLANPEAGFQIC